MKILTLEHEIRAKRCLWYSTELFNSLTESHSPSFARMTDRYRVWWRPEELNYVINYVNLKSLFSGNISGIIFCWLHVPYIDEALFVSEQQVSEEAGLGHVSQFDHVFHTLHWHWVHGPEGGFLLPGQTLFLKEEGGQCFSHVDILILHLVSAIMFTFPSSSTSTRWPDGVTLTLAPMATPMSESTQTHFSWNFRAQHMLKNTLCLISFKI